MTTDEREARKWWWQATDGQFEVRLAQFGIVVVILSWAYALWTGCLFCNDPAGGFHVR